MYALGRRPSVHISQMLLEQHANFGSAKVVDSNIHNLMQGDYFFAKCLNFCSLARRTFSISCRSSSKPNFFCSSVSSVILNTSFKSIQAQAQEACLMAGRLCVKQHRSPSAAVKKVCLAHAILFTTELPRSDPHGPNVLYRDIRRARAVLDRLGTEHLEASFTKQVAEFRFGNHIPSKSLGRF